MKRFYYTMMTFALLTFAFAGTASAYETELQNAIDGWNSQGSSVTALGYDTLAVIDSDTLRQSIVNQITNAATAYFPSGDIGDPGGFTAVLLSSDPTITGAQLSAYYATVDSLVQVGHLALTTQWSGFTTITIVDGSGLIHDNMFSNAAVVDPGANKNVSCLDYKMAWVWQFNGPVADYTRGHIEASNTITCDENGEVVSCDEDCDASMTAGEAQVNCKNEEVVGQECCKLTYSWAWACGFKKIKVGADDFTLEVEGIIGSSGTGNGSCTECCDEVTATEETSWSDLKEMFR